MTDAHLEGVKVVYLAEINRLRAAVNDAYRRGQEDMRERAEEMFRYPVNWNAVRTLEIRNLPETPHANPSDARGY